MPVFQSRISPSSAAFQKNRADMLRLIDKLNELNARAPALSAKRKARFEERGQLLPRERLARLLDPGMPWLQISNIAGYLVDTPDEAKSIAGSTILSGIGFIKGVRCVVVVDDSGIQAGAMTSGGGYRLRRAQEIALQQKMPFVHLVESAGGDLLNYKVEGFVSGGALFANLARLSARGMPVIALLHGSSTAGGAYMPGLSDYVVAVKGRGRAFLAGPPLLKAATGEIATEEELGGADMHATVSGLAEYLAENDAEACVIGREIVGRLGWNRHCPPPPPRSYSEPTLDPDEIAGIVPIDYRTPYDAREVIARIVDGSDFSDFKPGYGVSTVCFQAEVMGHPIGIIANNGPIDPDGATKCAQFLQLMDQAGTPAVFLQNTTGYLVGKQYEQGGMIKHGSKMIQAVTNISVPRITFMIGASYGAGNYGMCGRGYDPDFVYTWPNASTGVMGGEQAAMVMSIVAEGQAKAAGVEPDRAALKKQEERLTQMFNSQANAFYCSGHMMDDGMIDPRETRKTLGFLLATVWELRPNGAAQQLRRGTDVMTTLPSTTAIELQLKSGWLTVWFNQPDNRNALSQELTGDLIATLNAVRDDREVRGITLRGRGGIFCSGADLKAFRSGQQGGAGGSREAVIEQSKRGAGMFDLVNTMPQAVIAIVEGAAMAGGFGLACCCDVVICDANAKFAMTETAIGLSPAQISPFVIQKLGYATARRLMLTAARFDGSEAQTLGFADFVAEGSGALEGIEAKIQAQVLKCAPGAVADTKALILALPRLDRAQTVQAAAENFAGRMLSDEAREGVASFVEKRKPRWAVDP